MIQFVLLVISICFFNWLKSIIFWIVLSVEIWIMQEQFWYLECNSNNKMEKLNRISWLKVPSEFSSEKCVACTLWKTWRAFACVGNWVKWFLRTWSEIWYTWHLCDIVVRFSFNLNTFYYVMHFLEIFLDFWHCLTGIWDQIKYL